MLKHRVISIILIIATVAVGYFYIWHRPFKLGLDLAGGSELVYRADISQIKGGDISASMSSLRDVIERRVNIFGVSEPIVAVENPGIVSGSNDYKLVVDLPGITNVEQAAALIGKTPQLNFMLVRPEAKSLTQAQLQKATVGQVFLDTGLSGQYLDSASLQFTNTSTGLAGQPVVQVTFNSQGQALLTQITQQHKGEVLAIFLDGAIISQPVIQDVITDGRAIISGNFTPQTAQTLVQDLNYGALPVPIQLVSTQTIGPTLGADARTAGVKAGMIGFLLIAVFLIIWYRLPGVIAGLSLAMYIILSLSVFKLVPVTLTAAGIAGFILSIGMAVDANILIFERMKEELKRGKNLSDAMREGFSRAWLSIRDSNISSIITAIILFWLGTSAIKGFALTLGLGVLISMFTAITVSRTFLFAVAPKTESRFKKFIFSNGFHF